MEKKPRRLSPILAFSVIGVGFIVVGVLILVDIIEVNSGKGGGVIAIGAGILNFAVAPFLGGKKVK